MRTSVSCASCRKAKVKCIHQGSAPCERCMKAGNRECALTETRLLSIVSARKNRKRKQAVASASASASATRTASNGINSNNTGKRSAGDGSCGIHGNNKSRETNNRKRANNIDNQDRNDGDGNYDGSDAGGGDESESLDQDLPQETGSSISLLSEWFGHATTAGGSTNRQHNSPGHREKPCSSAENPSAESVSAAQVAAHLSNLTSSTIVQAVKGFTSMYPELAMIHLPTFLKGFQTIQGAEGTQSHRLGQQEHHVLMAAILAAYTASPSTRDQGSRKELYERRVYEEHAEKLLSTLTFASPHVLIAQALLIVALLKSNSFELHKAWMYCGAAVRTMQFCYGTRRTSPANDSHATNWAEQHRVIESRTFWACFNVSSMIDLGNLAQPLLPLQEMERLDLLHPLTNIEFALSMGASIGVAGVMGRDAVSIDPAAQEPLWNVGDSFQVISTGISAWSHAMKFLRNGGRRAPGMCRAENCPWSPTSPWSAASVKLDDWRARQHPALHYPSQSVVAHSSVGNGETFVFINMIYYLSIILLHREYFPFLPMNEPAPRGPIEFRLEEQAPPTWWQSSARTLFTATSSVAHLLKESLDCGALLSSPFAGFCAFISAYMNLYVTRFPQMNLGQSTTSKRDFELCYAYLDNFRQTCLLGEGWIKTIQSASLLYTKCTPDDSRWMSKSSQDFTTLHQSIQDFFGVDKSQEHLKEIDRVTATILDVIDPYLAGTDQDTIDQSMMLFFGGWDAASGGQLAKRWPLPPHNHDRSTHYF